MTVGTIARTYVLAQEMGLVVSGVGKGTFVAEDAFGVVDALEAADDSGASGQAHVDLSQNKLHRSYHADFLKTNIQNYIAKPLFAAEMDLPPHVGLERARQAGAEWINRQNGLRCSERHVVVCNGGQHAIETALRTLAGPGDTIIVEKLTFPGLKAAADALNIKLAIVDSDAEGPLPDDLETVSRKTGARVLYTMPSFHCSSGMVMGSERRHALAQTARSTDIYLIEDGVFQFLLKGELPPIAAAVPDRVIFIDSMMMSVASALQISFLTVPDALIVNASTVMRASTWSASPFPAAVAANAIEDGTAYRLAQKNTAEAARRQTIASELLKDAGYSADARSYHGMLRLETLRQMTELVTAARDAGVSVTPVDAFLADEADNSVPAVRLSLMGPESDGDVARALELIVDLSRSVLRTGRAVI